MSRLLGILLAIVLVSAACASFAEEAAAPDGGLAAALKDLAGAAFDQAYMAEVFQLNADVVCLATLGSQSAASEEVRDFSRKIVAEREEQNAKLAKWYSRFVGSEMPIPANTVAPLVKSLVGCPGGEFDSAYAKLVIPLMSQSQQAADLAIKRSTRSDIVSQAHGISRMSVKECVAFLNLLETGYLSGMDPWERNFSYYSHGPWADD